MFNSCVQMASQGRVLSQIMLLLIFAQMYLLYKLILKVKEIKKIRE